jgi:hypothetical protein
MKIWIVALALGLLLVAGVAVASSLQEEEKLVPASSCGSCNGGCSVEKPCSSPSCGTNNAGSCGCKG